MHFQSILLFLVLAVHPTSLEKDRLYPAKTVYDVLQTLPYSIWMSEKTLGSIKQWMESYVFLDFYQAPHFPLSCNARRILSSLDIISQANFSSDYQFQMTLWDLFRSLQDSHTLYLPPETYQDCQYCLPFGVVVTLSSEGEMEYRICSNSITSSYEAEFPQLEPLLLQQVPSGASFIRLRHVGMRVLAINGQSPTLFLLRLAETLSSASKDIHVRFNSILTGNLWNINSAVCNSEQIISSFIVFIYLFFLLFVVFLRCGELHKKR